MTFPHANILFSCSQHGVLTESYYIIISPGFVGEEGGAPRAFAAGIFRALPREYIQPVTSTPRIPASTYVPPLLQETR